ncbi:MAG: hypothetical protein L0Z50_35540 [Verrucomicrobiales bacterium]|nr:hypothetical protein [Verrucomicrobiales bacterium]
MTIKSNLFRTRTVGGLVLVVLCLSLVRAMAAESNFTDGNWSSMGGFPRANGFVQAAAVDGVGNLYMGGDFTLVGDVMANGIAKWDGTKCSDLGTVTGTYVNALAVSGSDVYAAGDFTATTVGGITVAKWNGTSWSPLGSGIGGSVSALAVSGSDLYAGGRFTMSGGVAANNIGKWNGSNWAALGAGMEGGWKGDGRAGSVRTGGVGR